MAFQVVLRKGRTSIIHKAPRIRHQPLFPRVLNNCDKPTTCINSTKWDDNHATATRGFFSSSSSRSSSSSYFSAFSNLRSVTSQDVDAFREMLHHQPGSVLTEADEVEAYNTDWTKHYQGTTSVVLRPQSTPEVSAILRYCHDHYIGVIPQAGNTGLVGGGIPLAGQPSDQVVIVSVDRMTDITSWNPTTGIIAGQAGGILQDWKDYALERNVILPIDLGSKGSCCIGGTVSTNAGGQYYARYKSLHANVVGLEVVLANGQILQFNIKEKQENSSAPKNNDEHNDNNNVLSNLKDNTGYDLKHLFIGAEGTLGIITKVALWCSSAYPTSRCAVLCACTSLEQVQRCLQLARQTLGETLAAFEFMDYSVTKLVANNINVMSQINKSNLIPKQQSSFSPATSRSEDDEGDGYYPYYILVETHGTNSEHDEEKMQNFLEQSLELELVHDGVLAQDLTQVKHLWKIRESCSPTVASHGYTYKYDVSLPMSEFASFAEDMKKRLVSRCGKSIVTTNWGHIMDGNLHFNVTTPGIFHIQKSVLEVLEPYIFESVIQRGGSISAEHGLGQSKHLYLPMVHDAATLTLMRSIKQLLDPHGIMNPGKYLPPA